MQHLVITGNGLTRITVARTVRKHSERRITVISRGHMTFEHTKPYEGLVLLQDGAPIGYDTLVIEAGP